ncbi:Peptidase M1 membrane alanine aminopeptidase [Paenibacillus curdlanolyticus YK9]|uniref:Peptidase M1 membrane alanine aminopeptidase n=1 Tax=Paenibacillus curdlanolyticus YK9 TaxID=717606 RepID=E0IDG1_9BACL|nr:M1 family metallopeptidase [Paenibacillus curdlanolyticus]EFM09616.1 Peptidase M1 membrane alanine aminopeptidase [Paenibacillus curdlanolyticus YK9]
MTPRHVKGIAVALLLAAVFSVTLSQGFGDAWKSQYTYAFSPVNDPIAIDLSSTADEATGLAPTSEPDAAAHADTRNQADSAPQAPARSTPNNSIAKPPAPPEPDTGMTPNNQALSKRVTEYHIDVKLDNAGRSLNGNLIVTWTNPGRKPVSELYWHLYPNAFQSQETTFMRESGGQLREDRATTNSLGGMTINSLMTEQGESLLPRLHYVQPDDGNVKDQTLAKLRLQKPVEPNKSVTLKVGFTVKLPEVFARMGYAGNFIMAGQWFPKLAVYEPAGTRGRAAEGWNAHQYHGNSEFYSDFGIYSVNITLPARYKVAATGFQTKPAKTHGDWKTLTFYADDVHDFAWAASPDFVYAEESFSAVGVPGVRIKLYLDPLHAKLKDRYMHAAKSALAKYAQWYGQYPYSTLSVVVPPKGGNGAGGMEYPTLVTSFAAEDDNPGYSLERTVVHEIGHQYWYGMVASNEFEEAWLDEGFTSYAEDKVMETEYGVLPNLALESSYMTDPAPLKQLSWSYQSHDHYAENVYMRAKLVLVGIEKLAGDKAMQKIMRTYFQKYKFKHPSTADFERIVEQVTKANWSDYFRQYVYGDEMADFAIESITVDSAKLADGSPAFESAVKVRRLGGSYGPVPVQFRFTDGTTVTRSWDGSEASSLFRFKHASPLDWASIDPQHTNVLDNKQINNYMKAELPERTRTRWSLGAAKLLEGIIGALGW